MVKKISAIIFYIIALFFLVVYVTAEIAKHVYISEFGRLFLLCGSCIFLYFGGLLLSRYNKNSKPMKINLWIFFGLYLVLFITLTLFDQMWGRNGLTHAHWSREIFNNYIHNFLNVIPFKTIIQFIRAFNGSINKRIIMFNLLGNIVACMPFGFFLPLLFKKQNSIKRFIFTMIIIVLIIEILQFITLSGSCDIDDIILNVAGALMVYAILKIKYVRKFINYIFLLEE